MSLFVIMEGTGRQELEQFKAGVGAYLIGFFKVVNAEGFMTTYGKQSVTIRQYDGAILAYGQPSKADHTKIFCEEGDTVSFDTALVTAFPTLKRGHEWHSSPEYQGMINGRLKNTWGPIVLMGAR